MSEKKRLNDSDREGLDNDQIARYFEIGNGVRILWLVGQAPNIKILPFAERMILTISE